MQCRLFFIIIALFVSPVYGQDGVRPDTLDWRDYYPLEKGNSWEWLIDDHFAGKLTVRQRIESDTLFNEQLWFIQMTHVEGVLNGEFEARDDTLLLRYDEPNGRVLAYSPSAGKEFDYTCDLSGDFGEEVLCNAGLEESRTLVFEGYYAEELGYNTIVVGSDTISFAALKQDPVIFGPVPPIYYHGVGRFERPGDGFNGSIDFTYLRLNGIEYGSPAQFVSIERPNGQRDNQVQVFPNPASNVLTLKFDRSFGNANVKIYDLRGRLIVKGMNCTSPCLISVKNQAPGIHLLDLVFEKDSRYLRRMVVIR